ncbi:MAG: hypothetical protein K2Q12_05465 [Rickettsiales bacterium]|nr:hypothetical protein [Rickettsiales bacterium]
MGAFLTSFFTGVFTDVFDGCAATGLRFGFVIVCPAFAGFFCVCLAFFTKLTGDLRAAGAGRFAVGAALAALAFSAGFACGEVGRERCEDFAAGFGFALATGGFALEAVGLAFAAGDVFDFTKTGVRGAFLALVFFAGAFAGAFEGIGFFTGFAVLATGLDACFLATGFTGVVFFTAGREAFTGAAFVEAVLMGAFFIGAFVLVDAFLAGFACFFACFAGAIVFPASVLGGLGGNNKNHT